MSYGSLGWTMSQLNAALQAEIEGLSRLKKENELLLAENRGLPVPTTLPRAHLPWEILRSIFLRAMVPGMLLDPDRRPQSAWNLNTKTKLQLIFVCKDWYEARISLLYTNIAIYTIGKFCALISTLRRNPSLAEHVSSLRLSCYILSTHASLFERLLGSLEDLCSKIQYFSFEGLAYLYFDSLRSVCLMPGIARSMLTHLDINVPHSFPFTEIVYNMYLFSERLELLIIRSGDPSSPGVSALAEHLRFPLLRTFQYQLNSPAIAFITWYWEFPALKTFGLPASGEERKVRFPKLQRYRSLDFELLNIPLIYVLLPPTMDEGRFNFPGVDIRCNAFALSGSSSADRCALSDYDSDDELDYSSGGSDWTPGSESESDEEEEDDDDSDDDEEWSEANEETTLSKWRACTAGS
ncbi:hypothetical protein BDP27DRAFT_1407541 [Rhodocollybia butyracea]|uniref:F-box domain-containing protein n=1 Tax=Rhodocollybia butyracea TaxID=206335 RepID=A0A9P5TXL1_9AGAR|nr:hypothetical protein BDP27DRAFT_1407541 [Rhodocollybia butyracea]